MAQHHDHAGGHEGHGHGHAHAPKDRRDHKHSHDQGANETSVGIAALLTGLFMGVEVVGGLFSGSLALIADAGHMLTDFASLSLAWIGFRLARRPADAKRSYGFGRFSVSPASPSMSSEKLTITSRMSRCVSIIWGRGRSRRDAMARSGRYAAPPASCPARHRGT